MQDWLIHFFNVKTFYFKQPSLPRFLTFNKAAAVQAYEAQCIESKEKVSSNPDQTMKRQIAKMKKKRIKQLTKNIIQNTNTDKRATKARQARFETYNTTIKNINQMNRESAVATAIAGGPGFMSSYERSRMATTRNPKTNNDTIPTRKPMTPQHPTTPKTRRNLKRLNGQTAGQTPIPGVRTDRQKAPRQLPAYAAPGMPSVSAAINSRVQQNKSVGWDELARDGIIGLSFDGPNGM
jgi:hypothetical protein